MNRTIWYVGAIIAVQAICGELCAQNEEVDLPPSIARFLDHTEKESQILVSRDDPQPRLDLLFGSFRKPLDIGEVGCVDSFHVLQVVDKDNVRVDLTWVQPVQYRSSLGDTWCQLEKATGTNVWIRGMPTAGLVDDADYSPKLPAIFEITGTTMYPTAVRGTKTILVLEPVDIKPFAAHFLKAADARQKHAEDAAKERKRVERTAVEEKERAQAAQREVELTRNWTDSTEQYRVTARLVEIKPGPTIRLRKENGVEVELKLFKLSKPDREWVLNRGKELLQDAAKD